MKVKLVDLYNTKFFYKTFCTDLNYLFDSIKRIRSGADLASINAGNAQIEEVYKAYRNGEDVVFDLADARLTSDALLCIQFAEDAGIVFCDSKNSWRDELFIENAKRRSAKASTVFLPEFGRKADVKEYIKNLSTEEVYNASGQPAQVLIALTCLIFIVRPKVQICIDAIARTLFKFINAKIPTEEVLRANDFWMCSDEGVLHVTGDKVYVQEAQCELPVKDALQYVILVPYEFGSVSLLQNPSYQGLFRTCLLLLQEYQEDRPRTLEDLYT